MVRHRETHRNRSWMTPWTQHTNRAATQSPNTWNTHKSERDSEHNKHRTKPKGLETGLKDYFDRKKFFLNTQRQSRRQGAIWKRSTHLDSAALLMDDPTEGLTVHYESFFNVQKDTETAKPAVEHSWAKEREGPRARQLTFPQQLFEQQSTTFRSGKSEHETTAEPLEALSPEQTQTLAEYLNKRCKTFQFDEGLTNEASVLLPKEKQANHRDRFKPIACVTTLRELMRWKR